MTTATATASSVKIVTTAELAELIRDMPAGQATFVLESSANSKMVKKHRVTGEANEFYDKLRTVSTFNCFAGGSYKDQVNNELKREGQEADFELLDDVDPKYESVDGSKALHRNIKSDKLHIVTKPDMRATKVNRSVFINASGQEVSKESLRHYLSASELRKLDGVTVDSGRQGTEKAVLHAKPLVGNVIEARMMKAVYKVVNPTPITMADLATRLGQTSKV